MQTSLYGASKLACEGLIAAYCEGFAFQSWIFRLVSILGERYSHGHVFDFCKQLRSHPTMLTVLGNGRQRKSYLYVQDCLDAVLLAMSRANARVNVFNLGVDSYCEVNDSIAWISAALDLSPQVTYTGGDRGWAGDNPFIYPDTTRIRALGWRPKLGIDESIRRTVAFLRNNPWIFEREDLNPARSGRRLLRRFAWNRAMIIARSPLRITLGGGGTDLPSYYRGHDGFLLAAAIDKYVYVTITRPFTQGIYLKYSALEHVEKVDQVRHPIIREALLRQELKTPQIEITTLADIPAGTGLGSSGSFTTALLKALYAHRRKLIHPQELAELACHLEIDLPARADRQARPVHRSLWRTDMLHLSQG